MSYLPLPPAHHYETLTSSSPAVVLGRPCAVTGRQLRPGDDVVVCEVYAGADPVSFEGWRTQTSCPHCGVSTGVAMALTPSTWGAPAGPPAAPAAPGRGPSSALVGVLLGLFLVAAGAIAVAAFIFAFRTRGTAAPPPTNTPPAATMTSAATAAPSPSAVPSLVASPTLPAPPTETPALPATPTPAPTPSPPPPTVSDAPLTFLWLVDPDRDRPIRALRAEDTVSLGREGMTHFNIVAEVSDPAIGSVTFLLDGQPFCAHGNCVENNAPFAMGGDQSGNYYNDWDWTTLLGEHTLTAIACTGEDGAGDCLPPVEVSLIVTR